MKDRIKEILNIAVWAPSGENCQPWHFELTEGQLDIFNLPERDQSLYSWGQRASYVAHGALIENIIIAAGVKGLNANVNLFPDSANENKVATIFFKDAPAQDNILFSFIKSRTSNRKPYNKYNFNQDDEAKLLSVTKGNNNVSLKFVQEPKLKARLGYLAALNEKIIFENNTQHQFFFNHINWTKEEDATKSIGFYIPTLELPSPAKVLFKIIRHWNIMRIFNLLKFGNLIAMGNGKVNSTCSAFGAIKISNLSKENCVEAGRVFQRMWLTASSIDLVLQPLTGMLFLKLMVFANETKHFSDTHLRLINDSYQEIKDTFEFKDDFVILMFRIGKADPATAHSSRLEPTINEL